MNGVKMNILHPKCYKVVIQPLLRVQPMEFLLVNLGFSNTVAIENDVTGFV